MSGVFETAAGAFAVVGVADVVIRSGRELYSFFADIADAPKDVERLRDNINDITLLSETSRECLNHLKNSTTSVKVIALLDSALKALSRELQSLKSLLGRFKGGNKAWGRIKYVLDERKTKKALDNLERSKTLLGNALNLAQK